MSNEKYQSLLEEIQKRASEKSGKDKEDVEDPNDAGTVVTPPGDPEAEDPQKANKPADGNSPKTDNKEGPESEVDRQLKNATLLQSIGARVKAAADSMDEGEKSKKDDNKPNGEKSKKDDNKPNGEKSKKDDNKSDGEKSKKDDNKSDGEKSEKEESDDGNKKAGEESLSQQDMLELKAKIASTLMETEEGVTFINDVMAKKAGQERAQEMVQQLLLDEQEQEKQAQQQYFNQVDAMEKEAALNAWVEQLSNYYTELTKNASEEDMTDIEKLSSYIRAGLSNQGQEEHKIAAFMQGAQDAAGMMDTQEAGQAPMLEGAEGEPSIEEILMIIEQLVQAGQLDPVVAEQLIAELVAEEEAGGALPEEDAALAEELGKAAKVLENPES